MITCKIELDCNLIELTMNQSENKSLREKKKANQSQNSQILLLGQIPVVSRK